MSTDSNVNIDPQRNAVSLYSQEGSLDDFPVLKAFQQYVDAEQSRARKRLAMLCIVFCAMMCAIVSVFLFMLKNVSERNQQLNDRLIEYVMRDRDRQTVVVQPAAPTAAPAPAAQSNEAVLKTMTDAFASMQRQMEEQFKARDERQAAETAAAASQSAAAEKELARKTLEAEERIRKAQALLEADRKKLEEEKARIHNEEVERHRRRLYPDYYAKQDAQAAAPAAAVQQGQAATPQTATPQTAAAEAPQPQPPRQKAELSDKDIEEILREAGAVEAADEDDDNADDKPAADAADTGKGEEKPAASEDATTDIDDAIEYFKDDEYQIPVEVKGTTTKWHVPLD